jgi:hypothetical protein
MRAERWTIYRRLHAMKRVGTGSISGFATFVAIAADGELLRHQTQRGGTSTLFLVHGRPICSRTRAPNRRRRVSPQSLRLVSASMLTDVDVNERPEAEWRLWSFNCDKQTFVHGDCQRPPSTQSGSLPDRRLVPGKNRRPGALTLA